MDEEEVEDEEVVEKEDKERRLKEKEVREQEQIEWSLPEKRTENPSYLTEAASRVSGFKSFVETEEDANAEMFCGFSLKQMRTMQQDGLDPPRSLLPT